MEKGTALSEKNSKGHLKGESRRNPPLNKRRKRKEEGHPITANSGQRQKEEKRKGQTFDFLALRTVPPHKFLRKEVGVVSSLNPRGTEGERTPRTKKEKKRGIVGRTRTLSSDFGHIEQCLGGGKGGRESVDRSFYHSNRRNHRNAQGDQKKNGQRGGLERRGTLLVVENQK